MAEQQKENTVFQTGSTQPPKSYQGVIALLLVLVVILGGIITLLSMMNIRLFQMLADSQQEELLFETDPYGLAPASLSDDGYAHPELGMVLQELDGVYQSYMELPAGLYICQVLEEGFACRANFRSGDILTAINGQPVTDLQSLHTLLAQPGVFGPLRLTVIRDGHPITAIMSTGE